MSAPNNRFFINFSRPFFARNLHISYIFRFAVHVWLVFVVTNQTLPQRSLQGFSIQLHLNTHCSSATKDLFTNEPTLKKTNLHPPSIFKKYSIGFLMPFKWLVTTLNSIQFFSLRFKNFLSKFCYVYVHESFWQFHECSFFFFVVYIYTYILSEWCKNKYKYLLELLSALSTCLKKNNSFIIFYFIEYFICFYLFKTYKNL